MPSSEPAAVGDALARIGDDWNEFGGAWPELPAADRAAAHDTLAGFASWLGGDAAAAVTAFRHGLAAGPSSSATILDLTVGLGLASAATGDRTTAAASLRRARALARSCELTPPRRRWIDDLLRRLEHSVGQH